MVRS